MTNFFCFTRDYSIYVGKCIHEKIGFSYAVVIGSPMQKFIGKINLWIIG